MRYLGMGRRIRTVLPFLGAALLVNVCVLALSGKTAGTHVDKPSVREKTPAVFGPELIVGQAVVLLESEMGTAAPAAQLRTPLISFVTALPERSKVTVMSR